jgi:hypothetical protein
MDTWLRHYDRKRPPFPRCASTTGRSSTTATFAICCNTDPYTYLGSRPLHLAPDATLDRSARDGDDSVP